ncbi:hypothetical protein MAR_020211 [Mya arenaria]|uniref:Uncharacterized protein n=1 Tax=Mya arenaria TaxID=6604 RepID=A0ABY7E7R4_MYAAR|nr:hypothetical protein MAR_020211 [Mya arenaria]
MRIARHLNYRRSFPTATSARVDIPCIPYEAFDYTGNTVNPWSLMRLVESVRAYTFWKHVSTSAPNTSMMDLHDILKSRLVFIIGARLQIMDRAFHEFETPKHPLYCITALKNLGKSSKTLSYDLFHEGSDRHLVSCDVTDVLVDEKSRKPIAYPDWWLEKYGHHVNGFRRAQLLTDVDPGSAQVNLSYFRVTLSDTDTYRHCNWASFLKYCYESMFEHVSRDGSYAWITSDDVNAGLRHVDMLFRNEATLGDVLIVQSWSECDQTDTGEYPYLKFRIINNGNSCFEAKMAFFEDKKSIKHKL